MHGISFGHGGKSDRVRLMKLQEEYVKLRNATKFLLNDISPAFHQASEEKIKIKKFMESWLEIPTQEQKQAVEKSFERL